MNNEIPTERVLEAYGAAPSFVREAFNAEKTTTFLVYLREKYGFHIDTAGMLGKQVGYLLLGLVNPSDFYRAIVAAGMSEDIAKKVTEEINQNIFMPLNQGLRASNMEVVRTPPPPPPAVARPMPASEPPMVVRTLPPLQAAPPIPVKAPQPASVPPPPPTPRPVPPVPANLPGVAPEPKTAIPAPRPASKYGADPYRESFD